MSSATGWYSHPWGRRALIGAAVVVLFFGALALRGRKVQACRATRQPIIETVVVNGRVLAQWKSEIGSKISGTVQQVLVREGDRVRAGQLLVKLADSEERAQLEQARQNLHEAEARLQTMSTATSRRNSEAVEQARLRALEAERDAERLEQLSGLVPAADLESAKRNAGIARSEYASAMAAERSTAKRGSETLAAAAAVDAAQAAVAAAEARASQTSIVAPADGVILTRSVESGAGVSPARTLLVMTLDSETLLLAQPDEKNLSAFSVGQRARASADAYPTQHFDAVVDYIAPNVDLLRGTFDVKLRVPKPPPYLKTDMTLSIEVETARKASALVVAADAVREASGKPWVLTIARRKTRRQDVRIGIRGDNLVEIVSGLSEDDVVVRGTAVKIGERVRPDFSGGS